MGTMCTRRIPQEKTGPIVGYFTWHMKSMLNKPTSLTSSRRPKPLR